MPLGPGTRHGEVPRTRLAAPGAPRLPNPAAHTTVQCSQGEAKDNSRALVALYVEALFAHPPLLLLLLKTGVWGEDTSPYYFDSSLWPEGAMQGVRLCQELSADKWGQAAGASF